QDGPEKTEPAVFVPTPEMARQIHVGWPHRPRWRALLLTPVAAVRCLGRRPFGTLRYLWTGNRRFGLDILRELYLEAELVCLQPDLLHFEFGALAVGRSYLKEALGCRLSVSFRGYDLNYVGLEEANHYEEIWRSADAIHCLGEDLWRRARRRGCAADK